GAERVYGWPEEDVKGRVLSSVLGLDPADSSSWWGRLTVTGVAAYETNHVRRGGSLVPVHMSATLLRGDDGEPAGVITVATDISERAAAEMANRQLEERYTAVVEALEEGIVVVNADGTVQAANAAAERIFGVDADGLVGTKLDAGLWQAVHE